MTAPMEAAAADATMVASLLDLIGASWMSQAICVAAELRIPDLLAHEPQTAEELAAATQCPPASLYRLLRGLASLGLCVERENAVFALTPMGALLRSDTGSGVRSWAIWWGRHLWPGWHNLKASIRTGKSARELATGRKGYSHVERDPEIALIFNHAMAELTRYVACEVLRAYDFSKARQIVDIGGGYGELLTAILSAYPAMQGVVFDRTHAIEGAKERITNASIAARCDFVRGDFFESIPGGGDIYLLKSILHNWDDERAAVILRNCRRAMGRQSRLLLIERNLPERMKDSARERAFVRTDLNMLVGLGGRERTEAQYCALFAAAGLRLERTIETESELSVMEAALA